MYGSINFGVVHFLAVNGSAVLVKCGDKTHIVVFYVVEFQFWPISSIFVAVEFETDCVFNISF